MYDVSFLSSYAGRNSKIETDAKNLRLPFLAHKSERITPRVKSQARSQNNKSIALK